MMMRLLFGDKTKMVAPDRGRARPQRDHARSGPARGTRHADRPPFPDGLERPSSAWAASGAPSASSGRPRRLHDRGRLRGRLHAEPDLRGGLLRPAPATPRSCSSSSTRRRRQLRGDPAAVLGEPRPDAGHAPGQRRRHAVPLGDLRHDAGPARGRGGARATMFQQALGVGRLRADHDRDRGRPAPSTTPSRTTSSTWPRTRTATAASAAPASSCPIGLATPAS